MVGENFKMRSFIICAPLQRVFENRMLGRIILPNRDEVIGCWRNIQNERLLVCTHLQILLE
jgi:hypothetical protein